MVTKTLTLSDNSLERFTAIVNSDTIFVHHFFYEGGMPVIVFNKAESRFRSSQLFRDLKSTGVEFKILTRRKYNDRFCNR